MSTRPQMKEPKKTFFKKTNEPLVSENLFRDNKDVCGIQLDQELHSIEIGDMTVTEYFKKIKFIFDILVNIEQLVS